MPVISPLIIKPDYSPAVNEEAESVVGTLNENNVLILSTLTIPSDIKDMSINLSGPFIINTDTMKGVQTVTEGNEEYVAKFTIYDMIKKD